MTLTEATAVSKVNTLKARSKNGSGGALAALPAFCYSERMKYKVLLLASGVGSRLGELTKNQNKALVPINGRATVEYILDKYPADVPMVVTLGYLGEGVIDYLTKNHPERTFEFVWIDKELQGDILGFSILMRAKEHLQCPFIFQACDTLVAGEIPAPEHNWIGGYVEDWQSSTLPLQNYDTCTVEDGRVVRFNVRGTPDFDSIYLGLDGVFDYELYWKTWEALDKEKPAGTKLHPIAVYNQMLKIGTEFRHSPYSQWIDTGTPLALKKAEEYYKNK
jgi:choline kinase